MYWTGGEKKGSDDPFSPCPAYALLARGTTLSSSISAQLTFFPTLLFLKYGHCSLLITLKAYFNVFLSFIGSDIFKFNEVIFFLV